MRKPKTFTAGDVRGILEIRQRTLDYWDEQNVVRPSWKKASGKGSERKYLYRDLVELSVVKQLRATGLSLQRIQKGLRYLRQFKRRPLRDVVLVTDGDDLWQRKGDRLISVLRGGQMAISVVFLGRIPETIDMSIKKLDAEKERRRRERQTKTA